VGAAEAARGAVKVVVTGAAGQLGTDVVAHCREAGDDVLAADRGRLDVTDRDEVHALLAATRPDAVINTAAYTAVDACESHEAEAALVNDTAVRWLAESCSSVGAHLVHVSTDYVFDGTLDRPYREDDEPHPMTAYGRTKLGGERSAGPDAAIARTSWVCGEHGANIVELVLRLSAERDELAFVDDQRGSPTFTADLAPALRRLAIDRRRGVHHLTNQGAVTWYEFVREILRAAGRDPAMVRPITTAELDPPRPARRPANSVLDNAVWRAAGLPMLRDFHAPLAELVDTLTRR
jgi:dTDP-4-dehydrorhamnose reductase